MQSYEEHYERKMLARVKAGKSVKMWSRGRGWQYIDNTGGELRRAESMKYISEDDAVAAGVPAGPCGSQRGLDVEVPKATQEKPKAKRGPGRPRKVAAEDGE